MQLLLHFIVKKKEILTEFKSNTPIPLTNEQF